jgi:cell division protein FtsZ
MQFDLQKNEGSIIKVIGVGGGGSNAVTHMFKQGIVGVDFAISNTDSQAMELSPVSTKIQLGPSLTEGRGAGSKPTIGRQACLESIDSIQQFFSEQTKMVFITAGMGGGTGTGAAPIIAKAAQEMDILTVAIVTLPFSFEGRRRIQQAMDGLQELKKNVDTLIVISNDKLREIHGGFTLSEAFAQADNILTTAAKGIAEIITVPGYVNVDFEDVNTVMRGSGVAIMGTAMAEGDDRAKRAVDEALSSPLLEDNDIQGAQHILLNIASGSKEVTMEEIFQITEFVQEEAGFGTDLIWGNCYDESLGNKIAVTVIATGFERDHQQDHKNSGQKVRISLDDELPDPRRSGIFDSGYNEGEKANTVEFDDVRSHIEKYQQSQRNPDEPYVRENPQTPRDSEEARRRRMDADANRRRRLNELKPKLNNPQTISELENQPAYLRRKVQLDDPPHSSDESMSKWTISDEEEPELRSNNSFLHDNVD